MKKLLLSIVLFSVAGVSHAAGSKNTDGMDYDRFEIQWEQLDTDNQFAAGYAGATAPGETMDAFGLLYANRLRDNFLVEARYWSADGHGVVANQAYNSDLKQISFGGGYIVDISEKQAIDFQGHIGRITYSRSNLAEYRSNLLGASTTYRMKFTPSFEFNAGLRYSQFSDERYVDELTASVGLDYRFSRGMSFGVSYNQHQDSNATAIRMRILL